MAKSINFDTGIKEFVVNGDENNVIRINVSDPNLIGRMEKVGEQIGEIIARYEADGLTANILDFDAEIKQAIDDAFNADISSHAFGNANCFSYVGDGSQMLVEAFLDAFKPIIEEEIKTSVDNYGKAHSQKIESYIADAVSVGEEDEKSTDYAEFLAWKAQKEAGAK